MFQQSYFHFSAKAVWLQNGDDEPETILIKCAMAGRFKGVFRQSGVIPVLDGRLVLITSRKSERWIIPKGYVEKGLSPAESAAKEAYEEAGLIGLVHHKEAGKYRYRTFGKNFSDQVYPLFI